MSQRYESELCKNSQGYTKKQTNVLTATDKIARWLISYLGSESITVCQERQENVGRLDNKRANQQADISYFSSFFFSFPLTVLSC